MSETVQSRLAEFKPTDASFRLVQTVLKIIPGAPAFPPYAGLADAVAAMGGNPEEVAAATPHLADEDIANVLWMSRMVDMGDRGYAIFTGLSSALCLFFGRSNAEKRSDALDTDVQQRNDAVLKALAIAYLTWRAFPGSLADRARWLTHTPSGQALLNYYAAIEIGLPFADNALLAGGRLVDDLFDRYGALQLDRMGSLAEGRDMGGVSGMLGHLTGSIKQVIDQVTPYLATIALRAREFVPTALEVEDKVAGALATAADVLPVYRLLGGRLAAEAAVVRGRTAVPAT